VLLNVVSPLAEVADRIVALEVLKYRDSSLEAPMPFGRDKYIDTFEEGATKEFLDLLDRADVAPVMPESETDEDAFLRVGRYVVEHCDVLLAIWDGGMPEKGKRGGTADIVRYARDLQVPLVWLDTSDAFARHEERIEEGIAARALHDLKVYNRFGVTAHEHARASAARQRALVEDARRMEIDPIEIGILSDWITPFYVRSDMMANVFRRRYNQVMTAIWCWA
jgi:hypothetical protein